MMGVYASFINSAQLDLPKKTWSKRKRYKAGFQFSKSLFFISLWPSGSYIKLCDLQFYLTQTVQNSSDISLQTLKVICKITHEPCLYMSIKKAFNCIQKEENAAARLQIETNWIKHYFFLYIQWLPVFFLNLFKSWVLTFTALND